MIFRTGSGPFASADHQPAGRSRSEEHEKTLTHALVSNIAPEADPAGPSLGAPRS